MTENTLTYWHSHRDNPNRVHDTFRYKRGQIDRIFNRITYQLQKLYLIRNEQLLLIHNKNAKRVLTTIYELAETVDDDLHCLRLEYEQNDPTCSFQHCEDLEINW